MAKRTATKKRRHAKNNTRKHVATRNHTNNSSLVKQMLELLVMVRLYHWKTHSYAQHKATDELYEKLDNLVDQFVEVLLGKSQTRVSMIDKYLRMYDFDNTQELKDQIFEYRQFLQDMNRVLDPKKDSDLLNIRDEMLANLNQFLYLLSFDKV